MIINKIGEIFEHKGTKYVIGAPIVGTKESIYNNLLGHITEIRNGDDKETANSTVDIYCSFDAPSLEDAFSELYKSPKKLNDIIFDSVIMSPDMIKPICVHSEDSCCITLYLLFTDWAAYGDSRYETDVYLNLDDTLMNLRLKVKDEKENGLLAEWSTFNDFIEDSSDMRYSGYIDGWYYNKHFDVFIVEKKVQISREFIADLNKMISKN